VIPKYGTPEYAKWMQRFIADAYDACLRNAKPPNAHDHDPVFSSRVRAAVAGDLYPPEHNWCDHRWAALFGCGYAYCGQPYEWICLDCRERRRRLCACGRRPVFFQRSDDGSCP
jgi:hypothetical protein